MDFNGRVNLLEHGTQNLFALQDKIPIHTTASYRDALQGNLIDSPLSVLFFSKENIQLLHNGIRAGVYARSNGLFNIGPQSEDDLKIIMRSVFLTYSANMPTQIREQIAALNKLVLDYAVDQVYGEAKGYMRYLYDASTLVVPIDRPTFAKNDKTLEWKRWF